MNPLMQALIALMMVYAQADTAGIGATLHPGAAITYSENLTIEDPNPDMRIVLTFEGVQDGACIIALKSAQQEATFSLPVGRTLDETPVTPALWCGLRDGAPVLAMMSHVKTQFP